MFDMLGESVPAPMIQLEISTDDDTTDQERVIWERDLLGVELTQSPFTLEMRQQPNNIIVFSSDITADIAGQKRAALGQVNNVRELSTRRGDKFLSLNLTLLDGDIELVVWPNILEKVPDLWHNGNFVSVTGEVRERMGRVSISVEKAHEYQLKAEGQAEHESESAKNEPEPIIRAGFNEASQPRAILNDPIQITHTSPKVDETGPLPLSPDEITNSSTSKLGGEESPEEITADLPTDTEPDENATHNGHFLVHVKETGDIANDRYRLDDLMRLFVEFDGSDPVILEIDTGEKVVRLNMPFKVRAGTKLTNRLNELLGNKTVHTRTVSN